MNCLPVTPDHVRAAHVLIRGHVRRTPSLAAQSLFGHPSVSLKLELLQHAGSFKTRGAFHTLPYVAVAAGAPCPGQRGVGRQSRRRCGVRPACSSCQRASSSPRSRARPRSQPLGRTVRNVRHGASCESPPSRGVRPRSRPFCEATGLPPAGTWRARGGHVGVLLCGANVDLDKLAAAVATL